MKNSAFSTDFVCAVRRTRDCYFHVWH